MKTPDHFLQELSDKLTDDLHKHLMEAYQDSQTYEALLTALNCYVEARIHEIEDSGSTGDQGLQPETRA